MAKDSVKKIDDSGNWNNAKRYSDSKILLILESLDKYEIIAQFGFHNYDEYTKNYKISKSELGYLKFQGFKFLVAKLIQLADNSNFAVVNNSNDLKEYHKKLKIINSIVIPKIEKKVKSNNLSLPKYYPELLSIVKQIKSLINTPLNKNNLIFMSRAEYDPQEAKRRIFEEAGALEE